MRKLVLLCAAALVVQAAMASSASAAVEFLDEKSAKHCPPVAVNLHVVTGGCPVHVKSSKDIVLATEAGVVFDVCGSEFEARIDEVGHGWIYNQTFAGCKTTRPCQESETGPKEEWEIEFFEQGPAKEVFQLVLCTETIVPPHDKLKCTLHVGINTPAAHSYEIVGPDNHCEENNNFEIKNPGHWTLENDVAEEHPNIEIKHP